MATDALIAQPIEIAVATRSDNNGMSPTAVTLVPSRTKWLVLVIGGAGLAGAILLAAGGDTAAMLIADLFALGAGFGAIMLRPGAASLRLDGNGFEMHPRLPPTARAARRLRARGQHRPARSANSPRSRKPRPTSRFQSRRGPNTIRSRKTDGARGADETKTGHRERRHGDRHLAANARKFRNTHGADAEEDCSDGKKQGRLHQCGDRRCGGLPVSPARFTNPMPSVM